MSGPDELLAEIDAHLNDDPTSAGCHICVGLMADCRTRIAANAALAARCGELQAVLETIETESRNGGHWGMADVNECARDALAGTTETELERVLRWLDNNTTWQAAETSNAVLASVSKRIWYHATDDTESWPFSAVVRAALASQAEGEK